MPATRNLKILGGTALAAIVIGGATYGFTAQELKIVQLENKAPVIQKQIVVVTPTSVPTATPEARLKFTPVVKSVSPVVTKKTVK